MKILIILITLMSNGSCNKSVNKLNIENKGRNTNLINAVRENDLDKVKKFLNKGANVNYESSNKHTPLIIAVEKGYKSIAKVLVENGANINHIDKDGYTPLTGACYFGHKEIAQLLIEKGANINYIDYNKKTPLIYAIEKGYPEIAEILIKKGPDVNYIDKDGYTPLTGACYFGYKETAKLLIEKGANINYIDYNKKTPLIYAIEKGYSEIAEILIEKGADVNHVDKDGYTPLTGACYFGHKKVVQLLIERGANIDYIDYSKNTPLNYANKMKHSEIVKLLIKKGEDEKLSTARNRLIDNIKSNDIKNSLKLISEYKDKIDFNFKDKEGNYPFHYASLVGNIVLLDELLACNCDINILNIRGESPLYFALSKEKINENTIWYLINKGANLIPDTYINNKPLVDALLNYEELFNKFVYKPLAAKLVGNEDLNYKNKDKIKDIIVTLKLKVDDFIHEQPMTNFLTNILTNSNLNINIDDINVDNDNINNQDIELNIEVFNEIFMHFKDDDYCDSVIAKGINKSKEMFKDRLNRIKNAKPITISYNSSEEDKAKYMDFISKKRLSKLLKLISIIAGNGKNNEKIRMAMNELLDHLVCRNGSLEAINAAIRYLSGEEDTELKDIINEQLMILRYEVLKEVMSEEINKGNVTVKVDEKIYKTELTGHLLSHLTLNIGNDIKVKPLYDEYSINYTYDKDYIVKEVLKRYKVKMINYVRDKIEENRTLWNKVRDYIERDICKGRAILLIDNFMYDKEYKIKEEVIKALLIYFNFLKSYKLKK